MGDPSLDWEIVDYYRCLDEEDELGSEKSKLIGWMMNTGMSFGKKVAMTGIVISSVPIVLPPLVVISAIGFAFSIPFGVIFASYACTEKLMSKLLPSPSPSPSPPLLEYQTDEEKESTIQTGMEMVDYEEINDDVTIGSNPYTSEIIPSLTNGVDSSEIGDTSVKSNEDENNVDHTSGKLDSNFTVPIVEPDPLVTDGEEIRGKFVQTGIEGNLEDKSPTPTPTLSKGKGRKKNHAKKKDKESLSKGETKVSYANNLKLPGEMVPVQETSKDDLGNVSNGKEKQKKLAGTKTNTTMAVSHQQSTPIVSNHPGDYYKQSMIPDAEKSASTKLKNDEGIPGILEPKNAVAMVADKEELPEDKIWKQLDAIRVIVGFKATRHPSYFEELKALYLFTGIEPPSSVGDPSDRKEEFNDKLDFLMSVIGLKSQP